MSSKKPNIIPLIHAEKTLKKHVKLDSKGFFVIELDTAKKQIRVEYYSNIYKKNRIVSGKLQMVFVGRQAAALCDTIAKTVPDLRAEHYCYLGRELQKAEFALENKDVYVQDGC